MGPVPPVPLLVLLVPLLVHLFSGWVDLCDTSLMGGEKTPETSFAEEAGFEKWDGRSFLSQEIGWEPCCELGAFGNGEASQAREEFEQLIKDKKWNWKDKKR